MVNRPGRRRLLRSGSWACWHRRTCRSPAHLALLQAGPGERGSWASARDRPAGDACGLETPLTVVIDGVDLLVLQDLQAGSGDVLVLQADCADAHALQGLQAGGDLVATPEGPADQPVWHPGDLHHRPASGSDSARLGRRHPPASPPGRPSRRGRSPEETAPGLGGALHSVTEHGQPVPVLVVKAAQDPAGARSARPATRRPGRPEGTQRERRSARAVDSPAPSPPEPPAPPSGHGPPAPHQPAPRGEGHVHDGIAPGTGQGSHRDVHDCRERDDP
ncbi:hypothetical protein BJ965_000113 [Streptomyces luteogriseus]|uniref:Uncharacterized protein n=1 Tax=Streptomyces luteogriseus TaxID=68233 RepID=A0A7W7DGF1_9ACTN|nr:hypothetical protein [Streptomyces luteogriseus]